MPRIVTPGVVAAPIDIVRVARVAVVVVDVDIDLAPAPVEAAEHRAGHGDSGTPCKAAHQRPTGIPGHHTGIVGGGIGGVRPRAVNHGRVVRGNINDVGLGRLDDDRLPLRHHVLLGRGLQVTGLLRLAPQTLDRFNHIALLRQEGVADLLRPVELVAHHVEHVGKPDQGLHARIPGLTRSLVHCGFASLVSVRFGPARSLNHFKRIGRRHQDLTEQRIGIERDGRQQRIKLLIGKYGRLGALPGRVGRRIVGLAHDGSHPRKRNRQQSGYHRMGSFHLRSWSLIRIIRARPGRLCPFSRT